ncbi:MAG: RNA polymerase sigma factor [Clostridia bacterium]|nr:RNA polymerase sigma factor [Clostridia bacterium]
MNAELFQAETRRIEKLLYHIARSYLSNDQDAEDAVQDAMIKAWEKRKTLRDIRQFRPWMARILSNRCKDILRKRKIWSFFPLEEDTAQTEMPQSGNEVADAMNKLKPELRMIMTLHYVDGYSIQEMAETLGIPTGTIKTRMRNARKQLSRMLLIDWEDEHEQQ